MSDAKFLEYLEKVNTEIENQIGCHRDDLPDYDYWNAYEEFLSPKRCAAAAIRNAMSY